MKKVMTKDEIAAERFALSALTESWEGCRRLVEEGLKRGGSMPGTFKLLRQDVEKMLAEIATMLDEAEKKAA
jgi:hypothetical protein